MPSNPFVPINEFVLKLSLLPDATLNLTECIRRTVASTFNVIEFWSEHDDPQQVNDVGRCLFIYLMPC